MKKMVAFYFSAEFSPEKNTVFNRNETGICIFIAVGFAPKDKAGERIIEVARQLKEEGVQIIELCGGFGPIGGIKICEALNWLAV
ncbi:DUF6506 family protein [Enterococcus caccae]|uniref:Uncharacterized protein n=1 Tax=Enterococcus caccae ATCC BAA-1240 TaxID=1158612 RepID=R3WNC0_9ENTE|nr:DUF6506 family protein [Enterococcus caccae]EOL43340.1 hypothetical protein UC7_02669 [Enterococcus caccae ATCC BAA-1240]EOT68260.1 hypothetical protein I580_00643 [Enterococcus caccae ATCC BAA-1240]